MKKVIKVFVSLIAVLAAVVGIAAGIKMFFDRKKKTEGEEFVFEGDELENEELFDADEAFEKIEEDIEEIPDDGENQ
ncbi:MAG: hypothetical protein J6K88_01220 [Oscillospiraceae bacterium]|nr:hypothetical protein [Oscillospiraceae bacterium]